VPNPDRALHIFHALGVTGDGHGLVNRLLVVGAATQPYDAILVGVNVDVCQTPEVVGRQFGLGGRAAVGAGLPLFARRRTYGRIR
jgi:hypothetical protein